MGEFPIGFLYLLLGVIAAAVVVALIVFGWRQYKNCIGCNRPARIIPIIITTEEDSDAFLFFFSLFAPFGMLRGDFLRFIFM